ncbi:MAG: hypothetical protein GX660_17930 [Clostridiaceae bacterium]|nr:hypothetical protein [Clostridiaceae bacterium]
MTVFLLSLGNLFLQGFAYLSIVTDVIQVIGEVGPAVVGIFADTVTATVDIFYDSTTTALTVPGTLGVVGLGWMLANKMFQWVRGLFKLRG